MGPYFTGLKKYNAQIINADATQVYQGANIGTAKITPEEMEKIPHHMIDIVTLNDTYTVKDYQTDARKILDKLSKENKNVIIVGGSGLYLKALLYDYKFTEEKDCDLNYDELTNEQLKAKVDQIYQSNHIHPNNRKRLIRFISHYEQTGEIIKNHPSKDKPLYNFTLIGLTTDRQKLYNQLNKRVDKMIENGLIEEVRKLKNYKKTKSLIGYKEIIEYLDGKCTKTEAIDKIKASTRKYAKRQYTWFKNQFVGIAWFETDYKNFDNTIKKVEDYLTSL